MLMEEFDVEEGLSIHRKFYPVAAGMAGGSSMQRPHLWV